MKNLAIKAVLALSMPFVAVALFAGNYEDALKFSSTGDTASLNKVMRSVRLVEYTSPTTKLTEQGVSILSAAANAETAKILIKEVENQINIAKVSMSPDFKISGNSRASALAALSKSNVIDLASKTNEPVASYYASLLGKSVASKQIGKAQVEEGPSFYERAKEFLKGQAKKKYQQDRELQENGFQLYPKY
ncbi:hypothetical protein Dip510_000180 [Elusimicrobium posterum]|uniref:hypothetical protein n=1 Tax=Elusimicrobium posterum TaxID=3116653 RepID=UPI003C792607